MSQIAQLTEAEIEERFHVVGTLPVAFMLTGFARERDPFSVQFGGGQNMFLTTLLSVEPHSGVLIFDCSGSDETNRQFLSSERNVFVGRPAGIHVQFVTGPAREVKYEGGKAFAVSVPKRLLRLQRREYFRIETPHLRPLQFFGRAAATGLLTLPAHDISVAGIALTASAQPEGLVTGMKLENCHFSLPEDERDLFFRASVRHVTARESRTGNMQWRIGLQFDGLPGAEEARIQRYIARVERERHELI
ncbi:MAG: flagellar brake protein [Azonexus sp.]|nr:flagellar brake protein [Azonexus sp.]